MGAGDAGCGQQSPRLSRTASFGAWLTGAAPLLLPQGFGSQGWELQESASGTHSLGRRPPQARPCSTHSLCGVFIRQAGVRRMPWLLANHIALLVPHLGGRAYALRSAIVSAAASLVMHLSTEGPLDGRSSARPSGTGLRAFRTPPWSCTC